MQQVQNDVLTSNNSAKNKKVQVSCANYDFSQKRPEISFSLDEEVIPPAHIAKAGIKDMFSFESSVGSYACFNSAGQSDLFFNAAEKGRTPTARPVSAFSFLLRVLSPVKSSAQRTCNS